MEAKRVKVHRLVKALCLFIIFPGMAFAQTAVRIDALLDLPAVSYDTASRFVLEAADLVAENSSAAFSYARERGWLPSGVSGEDAATMGGVSLLVMQAFQLKGGFMYRITHSPRSAYHELAYKKIIQDSSDPAFTVSGDELLDIINRILASYGVPAKEMEKEKLVQEIDAQLNERAIQDTSVRSTEQGVRIDLANIRFLPDSAELTAAEKNKIEEIGRILRGIPQRRILVAGYTALAGTAEARMVLSRERAQAVADYLVAQGVRRADEITIQGYGADRPVAANDQSLNRRVEITILNEGFSPQEGGRR